MRWLIIVAACGGTRGEVAPPAAPARDAGVVDVVDARADAGVDSAVAVSLGPIDARIVGVEIVRATLTITVNVGSEAGITTAWQAALIDDWDRRVPGTLVPVQRVDRRTTRFAVGGTHLPSGIRARLYPPEP